MIPAIESCRQLLENDMLDEAKNEYCSIVRKGLIPHYSNVHCQEAEDILYQIVEKHTKDSGHSMPSPSKMVELIEEQRLEANSRKQANSRKEAASLKDRPFQYECALSVFSKVIAKCSKDAESAPMKSFQTFLFQLECNIYPREYSWNALLAALEKEKYGAYVIAIFTYMENTEKWPSFKRVGPKGKCIAVSYMVGALLSSRSLMNGVDLAVQKSKEYGCLDDQHVVRRFADHFAHEGNFHAVWELFNKNPTKYTANALLTACKNLPTEAPIKTALQAVAACLQEERRVLGGKWVTYAEMVLLSNTEQLTPQKIKDHWVTLPETNPANVMVGEACCGELNGVSKWSKTVHRFLENVSKQNSTGDAVEVERMELHEISHELTQMLRRVRGDGNAPYTLSIKIFQDGKFRHFAKLDEVAYHNMLSVCARFAKPQGAENIFEEMKDKGLQPEAKHFNMLMDSYARAGMRHKVSEVLQRMHDANVPSNEVTRNILVKTFDRDQILDLLKQEDYMFDKAMILTLIPKAKENEWWDVADRLYDLGIKKGYYKPYRYEDNTLHLHDMSCTLAGCAWMHAKMQMRRIHAGHLKEESFSTDIDLQIDCGVSGHKLRTHMKSLLQSDGFEPKVVGEYSRLVIESGSMKQWLTKSADRWDASKELKVKNTFFEYEECKSKNETVTHSTTDWRMGRANNFRRKVPADISIEPSDPEKSLDVSKRKVGTIRSYDCNKSRGFIECREVEEACGKQVYMHKSVFQDKGFKIGDKVSFLVHFNNKGYPMAQRPLRKCLANAASSSSGR